VPVVLWFYYEVHDASSYTFNTSATDVSAVGEQNISVWPNLYMHSYSPETVASKKEIQKLKKYTIIKSESKKNKQYAL